MKALVERLRTDRMGVMQPLGEQAAGAIEKLEAENAQLKAELAGLREQKPLGYISPYEVNTILWNAGHENVGCNSAIYAAPGAK